MKITYPQDTAEKLASIKNIISISKYGCCAFVFLWWLGLLPDNELDAIKLVDDGINKGNLDKECTVYWDKWGYALTGRNFDVVKKEITSIKDIKDPAPVWFSIDGKNGHWVGVKNGKVVFNPKKYSKNVAEGKPRTMRIITVRGLKK